MVSGTIVSPFEAVTGRGPDEIPDSTAAETSPPALPSLRTGRRHQRASIGIDDDPTYFDSPSLMLSSPMPPRSLQEREGSHVIDSIIVRFVPFHDHIDQFGRAVSHYER